MRSTCHSTRDLPSVRSAALIAVLTVAALMGALLTVSPAAATPATAATATQNAARAAVTSPSAAPGRAKQAIVKQRKRALKLLDRVNAARRHARTCGTTHYPAAKPLKYRAKLATAARRHARDMARHNYFSHDSRSGAGPSQRARAAGYRGGAGENIAAGYGTVARTMRAWLNSPGHCANIMSRSYKHLGIGYAYDSSSTYRDYWVQDFGTG